MTLDLFGRFNFFFTFFLHAARLGFQQPDMLLFAFSEGPKCEKTRVRNHLPFSIALTLVATYKISIPEKAMRCVFLR